MDLFGLLVYLAMHSITIQWGSVWFIGLFGLLHSLTIQCTMRLATQLDLLKVKAKYFLNFDPNFENSTSGWSKTLKIVGIEYSHQIFVKNVVLVGKKTVGYVREI